VQSPKIVSVHFEEKNDFQWYRRVNVHLNGTKSVESYDQPEMKYSYLTVAQMSNTSVASQSRKQVESFKICEKLPPKKSRTKYTKEQARRLLIIFLNTYIHF